MFFVQCDIVKLTMHDLPWRFFLICIFWIFFLKSKKCYAVNDGNKIKDEEYFITTPLYSFSKLLSMIKTCSKEKVEFNEDFIAELEKGESIRNVHCMFHKYKSIKNASIKHLVETFEMESCSYFLLEKTLSLKPFCYMSTV